MDRPDKGHRQAGPVNKTKRNCKGYDESGKLKKYAVVAHILQRIESKIFIDRIVKSLYKNYKSEIIITIHDSIMCAVKNAEKFKKIISQEFKKVNFNVKIKIENYKKTLN